MITTSNIEQLLMPLVGNWIMKVNNRNPPEHGMCLLAAKCLVRR